MQYIGGEKRGRGCVFCSHIAAMDDRSSLILHRSERAVVIMNLYPYNTGHIMIVPNQHEPSPETLDDATTIDMALLIPKTLRALRAALKPDGFNLGVNLGDDAGAGIAAHLHQHIVPRWRGDTNFMPLLSGTKVLPELLPVTYAKLRAEFDRESAERITVVVTGESESSLLLASSGGRVELPRVTVSGEPLWRIANRYVAEAGIEATLVGWAGPSCTLDTTGVAFAFQASGRGRVSDDLAWLPIDEARSLLPPADVAMVDGVIGPATAP